LLTLPLLLAAGLALLGLAQASRIQLALTDAADGAAQIWSRTQSSTAAIQVADDVLQADGLSPAPAQWAERQAGPAWSVTVSYPVTLAGWPTPILLRAQRTVVVP
jgi:hypothetical protein